MIRACYRNKGGGGKIVTNLAYVISLNGHRTLKSASGSDGCIAKKIKGLT